MTDDMIGGDDRGSISLFFAILLIFFAAMAGVLAEGAHRLSNISRAEDLASEAARAAAATLVVNSLADGTTIIDQNPDDGAVAQVEQLLAPLNENLDYTVDVAPSGRSVVVTVTLYDESWIPGFDINGVGTHLAQVIDPAEVP